jgi:hypothetical protein
MKKLLIIILISVLFIFNNMTCSTDKEKIENCNMLKIEHKDGFVYIQQTLGIYKTSIDILNSKYISSLNVSENFLYIYLVGNTSYSFSYGDLNKNKIKEYVDDILKKDK